MKVAGGYKGGLGGGWKVAGGWLEGGCSLPMVPQKETQEGTLMVQCSANCQGKTQSECRPSRVPNHVPDSFAAT